MSSKTTPFFLRSSFKRTLFIILIVLYVLLLIEAFVSYRLDKYRTKLITYLDDTFGYNFDLKKITFTFLGGVHLTGVSVFWPNQANPPVFIKDVFVRPRLLPLLSKRLVILVRVTEADLSTSREEEGINLQIIFSDIYKRAPREIPMPLAEFKPALEMTVRNAKLNYISNPVLKDSTQITLKNCRLYQEPIIGRFNCDINFMYKLKEGASVFKDNFIAEKIKCTMQTRIHDRDLHIDYVTLSMGKGQIIGSGINRNFAEKNPDVDINFSFSAVSLEELTCLKDTFDAQGTAIMLVTLNGPMNDVKTGVLARLYDCQLKYPLPENEFFEINKLNGQIEFKDKLIKVKNTSLEFENAAVDIENLTVDASPNPAIFLQLSLPRAFLESKKLPLDKLQLILNGKISDSLSGDVEINALYLRKGLTQKMRLNFNQINLDYKGLQFKYFRSETVNLLKDNSVSKQRLNFKGLSSKIYFDKGELRIKDLGLFGYGTALNGELDLNFTDYPALVFMLKGNDLNVVTLMEDMNVSDKLLSGSLDFNISFDNRQKKFLEGRCKIKDGSVDLGRVADILQLTALRNMPFEGLAIEFFITKEMVRVDSIRLSNPEVFLNAFWDTNGRIDGRMDLEVSSNLLKQSYAFRKLLGIARLKNNYVDFSFLLKGDPLNTRIMWMRGEFKDKLKQNISGWIERRIENEIDKVSSRLSDQ